MTREIKFRAWDIENKKMCYDPGFEMLGGYHQSMDHPIMQYTGFKDTNGEEIYEGDITDLGVVEWSNENGSWSVGPWLLYKKYVKVIGNIHENPELLGE